MIDPIHFDHCEKIRRFTQEPGMILRRRCAVFRATKALVTNTLLCYNFS